MVPSQTRIRRSGPRTKTGCLPCRRRRKKCDEDKPVCSGCHRNHLICGWTSTSEAPTTTEINQESTALSQSTPQPPLSRVSVQGTRSTCLNELSLSPSFIPAAFRSREAADLLDYFTNVTAPRMVGKGDIENPYITYNLQVAGSSTALQHAILAVSSCHRAYSDINYKVLAHNHYAVAIRSLKFGLTKWFTNTTSERLSLLAACLTLCWYEIIDANIQGSLYHHLRASGFMVDELWQDNTSGHKELLGFFVEQFSYLVIVANIGVNSGVPDSLLDHPVFNQSLQMLNQESPIYGFMFGFSHKLFEIILRIRKHASRCRSEEPMAVSDQTEFYSLSFAILDWEAGSGSDDPAYEQAGHMYQHSCLMFLHTLKRNTRQLSEKHRQEIDAYIQSFLQNFEQLSSTSPPWTTFMWPTLVAGSCMRNETQRNALLRLLNKSNLQMQVVDKTASWLSSHWSRMDEDLSIYGIFGLEETMREKGVTPCIG